MPASGSGPADAADPDRRGGEAGREIGAEFGERRGGPGVERHIP
jgi:hypothetical protein